MSSQQIKTSTVTSSSWRRRAAEATKVPRKRNFVPTWHCRIRSFRSCWGGIWLSTSKTYKLLRGIVAYLTWHNNIWKTIHVLLLWHFFGTSKFKHVEIMSSHPMCHSDLSSVLFMRDSVHMYSKYSKGCFRVCFEPHLAKSQIHSVLFAWLAKMAMSLFLFEALSHWLRSASIQFNWNNRWWGQ